jgi:hypothetical protein
MALPTDFLDEVETELREARRNLEQNCARLVALEGLLEIALRLTADLRRPITVFDLVRSATDRAERERRVQLVRELRT